MGVFIRGMEMPKSCADCSIGWCNNLILFSESKIRADNCPLVEVPEPHGDLIDRNILEQELRNGIKAGNLEEGYEHYANINSMDDCVECVRYTPTVIEAEGE